MKNIFGEYFTNHIFILDILILRSPYINRTFLVNM